MPQQAVYIDTPVTIVCHFQRMTAEQSGQGSDGPDMVPLPALHSLGKFLGGGGMDTEPEHPWHPVLLPHPSRASPPPSSPSS